jgi:hypothetical protein
LPAVAGRPASQPGGPSVHDTLDEPVEDRDHLGAGSTDLGVRLSEAFPRASLSTVPAGRTFLPLDRPGEVAAEIMAVIGDKALREG